MIFFAGLARAGASHDFYFAGPAGFGASHDFYFACEIKIMTRPNKKSMTAGALLKITSLRYGAGQARRKFYCLRVQAARYAEPLGEGGPPLPLYLLDLGL